MTVTDPSSTPGVSTPLPAILAPHVTAFEFVPGEHPEMRVTRTDGREAIFDIAHLGESVMFSPANDAALGLALGDLSAYCARHLTEHMQAIVAAQTASA